MPLKKFKIDCEEKLLGLVNGKPILYDKKLAEYKNKYQRENAWRFIAEQMQISAKECENLWTNLRKQYTEYKRKVKNPTGSSRKSQPYFRHALSMQFYDDDGEDDTETSQSNYLSSQMIHDPDHEENQENQLEELLETGDVEVVLDENGGVIVEMNLPSPQSQLNTKFLEPPKKNPKQKKMDPFEAKLLAAYEKKENSDEFESFSDSIVPKLRRIYAKNPKKAAEVQLKIQQLLIEAEYE